MKDLTSGDNGVQEGSAELGLVNESCLRGHNTNSSIGNYAHPYDIFPVDVTLRRTNSQHEKHFQQQQQMHNQQLQVSWTFPIRSLIRMSVGLTYEREKVQKAYVLIHM